MSNVNENVVVDLLPLYFSGEASSASRALVEDYFRQHPEFERSMRASQGGVHIPAGAPAGAQAAAMNRVKGLLRWRGTAMGLAIGLSLTPLSFIFKDNQVVWFMLRDAPGAAASYALAAVVAWVAYANIRRQTRLP